MAKTPRKHKPEPKVIPVGELPEQSEAELDRLAEVTPEDVASARALWRRLSPRPFKKLLDAAPRKPKE